MFSVMPVCLCKVSSLEQAPKPEDKAYYQCPVYRTEQRGNLNFIFTAQLKTPAKNPPRKWILAGVAMLLDVEGVSDEIKKADAPK